MIAKPALVRAVQRLRAAGIEDPARDARILLAHALQLAPERLLLHMDAVLTEIQSATFDAAITARATRRPVSQILGQRMFCGLNFRVTADTLDPRPETEVLVRAATERPFLRMLDLGTGTGCILLSCLRAMPMATGTGTDLSPAALDVARDNAERLGLARRARFALSNWFADVPGRHDLIVSNPPYIAANEMAALSPEVRDHEPHMALTPGGDGLDAYRAIARGAPARLMAGGRLLLEIGPTQGRAVSALLAAQGFDAITILPDMDGRDRVVVAVKPADDTGCGTA